MQKGAAVVNDENLTNQEILIQLNQLELQYKLKELDAKLIAEKEDLQTWILSGKLDEYKGTRKIERKPTKAETEEEVSEADRKLHERIAAKVKAELEAKGQSTEGVETFEEFYEMLRQEAVALQREYQPQLRNGIKITIDLINSVQKDKKDGDVDIQVKIAPNNLTEVIQVPQTIQGAKVNETEDPGSADKDVINDEINDYIKTARDISNVIKELGTSLMNHSKLADQKKALTEIASELNEFNTQYLATLGDGAHEYAAEIVNTFNTYVKNLNRGLPGIRFIKLLEEKINTVKESVRAIHHIENETSLENEMDMEEQDTIADIAGKFDILTRKAAKSVRRHGAVHEVDLALMPRFKGIVDLKVAINGEGEVEVQPGQKERVFAIGYKGALEFEGSLSQLGGERYYGILFPKGWVNTFCQDMRAANNGKTAREPSSEDFKAGTYTDGDGGDVSINIDSDKAFLIRAEDSTQEEGQITLHFDRNEIFIGNVSMIQFLRNSALAVVEFDAEGHILHKRTF